MTDDALERRFPRRLLLGGGAAAAALAAVEAVRPTPAAAAPTTNPWTLGGNTVATDGTNFIGTKNKAPIIFKTPKTDGSALVERMRVTPAGDISIGTTTPTARLDVVGNGAISVQGRSTVAGTTGVQGVSGSGYGAKGVSSTGTGVRGESGYIGVEGHGDSYGVIGESADAYGVYGTGAYGVYGSGDAFGVYGSGDTGVRGYSSNGKGVTGSGTVAGVYGTANSYPVWGDGGQFSVYGTGGGTCGVKGVGPYIGSWGEGASYGVYGRGSTTTGENYGVFGSTASAAGYGVISNGNARVFGTLAKTAGSFQIDHPLDPEHRWLSHSFVESPDMMNVYNGNVVLGANGTATVELPDYFEALNRDYRYQLTCIGAHAPVYVSHEVKGGRFEIAGGTKGLKVSWQVTGIRQDDYAKAHPIVVEQDKTSVEKGSRIFRPQGSTARAWPPEPVAPKGLPGRPAAVPEPTVPTPR